MTAAHSRLFRYRGRSMWPCFQHGDMLEYLPAEFHQIRPGDCIAYLNSDGQAVAHRVVRKGELLITRGDAMAAHDDEVVVAGRLLGRVVRRHRYGRASTVTGGLPGRLAGGFYHYAGRLDPQRPSRGGRLARLLRKPVSTFLRAGKKTGTVRRMMRSEGADLWFWQFGGRYVAHKESRSAKWAVAWPWSLLVEIREEPGGERAF